MCLNLSCYVYVIIQLSLESKHDHEDVISEFKSCQEFFNVANLIRQILVLILSF